jgi:hypothetical protein
MTSARKGMRGLAVLSLAIVAALWFSNERASVAESEKTTPPSRQRPTRTEPDETSVNAASARRVRQDWEALLKWIRSSPPPGKEEIRERLLATRAAWAEIDPQVLASVIRELLESGDDAATGLDFQVGLHGLLAGWPTLRVFLLDVLAISDPEMAMTTARDLLDKTPSPDEFATGLRSLTRQGMGRADDGELLSRFDAMLGHRDWRGSSGFAEAFDLARFVGTPAAARSLAAWDGNPALKSMAMDEFAAEHPGAMLEALNDEPGVSGIVRASLMARANPADPSQLGSVDAYLRKPELSNEEAAAFLKTFPLRSATTGYRLYGQTPSPYTFEQIKSGDLAAGGLVNTWVTDPALAKYRPEILSLQKRLSKWIDQAK